MRRVPILSFAFAVIVPVSGAAFTEPDGFRGIPWKSTEAEVRTRWPGLTCIPAKDTKLSERLCFPSTPIMIGDVSVRPILGFRADAFDNVLLVFDQSKFAMMERIFIERYGPPTAQEQKSVQNRMGAQYVNEHRYWTGPTMTITLRRYGTKLTEGWAIYSPSSAIQDLQKQTDDAAKKGAGDL